MVQLGSQLSGGRDQEFEARSARQHSETLFPNNNHKRAQLRYKGRRLESTLSSLADGVLSTLPGKRSYGAGHCVVCTVSTLRSV